MMNSPPAASGGIPIVSSTEVIIDRGDPPEVKLMQTSTPTTIKAILPILWELFPKNPYLLEASFEPLPVPPVALLSGKTIAGWPSGSAIDSEDTMAFSAMTGVRSMNEVFPLEKVAEAYDRMMSGGARFRVVLTISR